MEDRPVVHYLTPVITEHILEVQDKGTGGEGTIDFFLNWRRWIGNGFKLSDSKATIVVVNTV